MAQGKSAAKAVVDKTKELVAEYGKVRYHVASSVACSVHGVVCMNSGINGVGASPGQTTLE